MAHTLIVMRHAKSSWKTAEPDHRRPLSPRGVRDATVAGGILAGYRLDRVLSSSSCLQPADLRRRGRAGPVTSPG